MNFLLSACGERNDATRIVGYGLFAHFDVSILPRPFRIKAVIFISFVFSLSFTLFGRIPEARRPE